MTISTSITPCLYCQYLSNIKTQYFRIGMNYPTYLAQIETMISAMVLCNLQNNPTDTATYWGLNKTVLESLRREAFESFMNSYMSLYTAPE